MKGPRVAAWKRTLGWVGVLLSIGLGVSLGFYLMGGAGATTTPEITDEQAACFVVVMPILGAFFLILGAVAFGFGYLTNGLTFTFDQGPVWQGFKGRIWGLNIIVQTCLVLGFGFMSATVAGPLLVALGVGGTGAFVFPSLATGLVVYLALLPFNFWARLEARLVRRSLASKGLGELSEGAVLLGVSDADKSAFSKFFAPQDDVGSLSMLPEELVFQGEKQQLRIPRRGLRVSREGDAGNSAALFGIGHVVLRFVSEQGESAVRLHPIGDYTMWRYQKTGDALERRARQWLSGASRT